jgi:hypothetical protein
MVEDKYEKVKHEADEGKKVIEQKTRERDLLNKNVTDAEEKEREQASLIATLENETKKLMNKI